ncbi:potassium channel family protein [Catenuloplanes indicus]|uniref:Trk K+ transport system NAD-binding subunit n=1 Tax=Catenuloplanes indicus TaxID=137267 RepID=A0AAE3W3P3_9ACTN|nr:NAD-binding protein [Catenuloplanes indicus]MDQ0368114.1 Trk K+ transport system NAD-binding subunit [Catenuloplanes indicus]
MASADLSPSGRGRALARWWNGRGTGADRAPHYVVCGRDQLALRLINELLAARPDVRVTALVPEISALPELLTMRRVRTLVAGRLDEAAFESVDLTDAAALALVHPDDVTNIHAALCAREAAPGIRLVLRVFNGKLAARAREVLDDSAVLSDAAMAAPAFVAAALGEPDPTHFRLAGRTMFVARRGDVAPATVVAGLAATSVRGDKEPAERGGTNARAAATGGEDAPTGGELDVAVGGEPEILPEDQSRAEIVLAEATGRPAGTEVAARRLRRRRRRRRPVAVLLRAGRALVDRKLGVALLSVLGIILISGGVQARELTRLGGGSIGIWRAVYQTVLTTVIGAERNLAENLVLQVTDLVLTLAGLALIPLITAAVVGAVVNARLALAAGRLAIPHSDHVVVVGLGTVGMRVMAQLHDLGVDVVAVDKDPHARGVSLARRLGVPVITGDAAREETLLAAQAGSAQALVVASTDDVTNLQAALNARGIKPDLRVVLRLYDGDFARRIQRAFQIAISRSVSYLAAPAFAEAMMDREVKATIPVARHVLLVAEVTVAPGGTLVGTRLDAADRPGGARVIGLATTGSARVDWTPPRDHPIAAGDRLVVVARRQGLRDLIAAANPPAPESASMADRP